MQRLFGLNEVDYLLFENTLFFGGVRGGVACTQRSVEDMRHLTALFGLPVCSHVTYKEMLNEIS